MPVPVCAADTLEYKYVLINDSCEPDCDHYHYSCDPYCERCSWQCGDNRSLGLRLSENDEVELIEVVDSWEPGPSADGRAARVDAASVGRCKLNR
jgi:hypothetical protein